MNYNLEGMEVKRGEGKIPWFLNLAFLILILWAIYYLWENVLK